MPESFFGAAAASVFCFSASSLLLPVDTGGLVAVPDIVNVRVSFEG